MLFWGWGREGGGLVTSHWPPVYLCLWAPDAFGLGVVGVGCPHLMFVCGRLTCWYCFCVRGIGWLVTLNLPPVYVRLWALDFSVLLLGWGGEASRWLPVYGRP